MCGRYAATRRVEDLMVEYGAEVAAGTPPLEPDWNVAPTKPVPVVRQTSAGRREIRVVRWGLVPHWAADERGAARAINARAETVTSRPTFRDAVVRHRCVVPADGWYEWRDGRPFFVAPAAGGGLAFAGLYAVRGDLWTGTILTTASYGPLADLHARMPRVLAAPDVARWLDRTGDVPADLLEPPGPSVLAGLDVRPVSPLVGDHRHNGPALLEPPTHPPADVLFT